MRRSVRNDAYFPVSSAIEATIEDLVIIPVVVYKPFQWEQLHSAEALCSIGSTSRELSYQPAKSFCSSIYLFGSPFFLLSLNCRGRNSSLPLPRLRRCGSITWTRDSRWMENSPQERRQECCTPKLQICHHLLGISLHAFYSTSAGRSSDPRVLYRGCGEAGLRFRTLDA